MDLDIGRSLDRISKLPDSVLCHVLLFLPTEDAYGTSILSKRWQYLWTHVTTLEFDNTVDFDVDSIFENFVNTVLLLNVSCLEKFSLKLDSFYNFEIVRVWISTAIKRNVQKLDLCNRAGHKVDKENPFELPRVLFTCKTVVDLRLDGISLNVPDSVWLPSLKILKMDEVRFENGDSVMRLIHGCPVLEELLIYMSGMDSQKVWNISTPTLKRLKLTRLGDVNHVSYSDGIDELNEQQRKLVLNAPKLEYLDLTDYEVDQFSLENLSSLLEARIHVWLSFSASEFSNILKLLHGIESVKFLNFDASSIDGYLLQTFHTLHNLTNLRLLQVGLLNVFLEYSPNIEVLVLEGHTYMHDCQGWSLPPRVPSCLSLNLKNIEYLNFDGDNYELEVIEYLLKSAEVLKNMTIFCRKKKFRRVIALYPRSSKICKLNFC